MGMLENSTETARLYIELGELHEKKRQFLMEAGLKAFELFKKKGLESDTIHRLSDDITEINNAIQVAGQEANLEKRREISENLPQWKKILDDLIYKLINSAERMEAKRRYDALVLRGQDMLEEAGKIATGLAKNNDIEPICIRIREVERKINETTHIIHKREKDGTAGLGIIVGLISFGSSFAKFFKTKF
jgi:hypothetical protein